MDRDIIIGLLSALPGIIALILYIIDSYKDRYKLSIIKRKENLIVQSQSIGKEEVIDGNIKTNEDLSDYLQTESNKCFANFKIIISNLGRRPITINKIKVIGLLPKLLIIISKFAKNNNKQFRKETNNFYFIY